VVVGERLCGVPLVVTVGINGIVAFGDVLRRWGDRADGPRGVFEDLVGVGDVCEEDVVHARYLVKGTWGVDRLWVGIVGVNHDGGKDNDAHLVLILMFGMFCCVVFGHN